MRALALLVGLAVSSAAAQPAAPSAALPPDTLPLGNLDAFRPPTTGWRLVGGAAADRARGGTLATTPGAGVLLADGAARAGAELRTVWEHGDLDLDLDLMPAQGADVVVYLQGRYAVRLGDSWGPAARRPAPTDAGAVDGHPPRVNAGRAPGLWQHVSISFRAPRFDPQGRKVADARVTRVEHDGVVVHEDLRVPAPSPGAPLAGETAVGPLVVRASGAPVAIRRVGAKRYSGDRVRLTGLRWRAAEGAFADLAAATGAVTGAVTTAAPARRGEADVLSSAVVGAPDKYAVTFDGTLRVPNAGRYRFDLGLDWVDDDPHFTGVTVGGARLAVGGREVLVHDGRRATEGAAAELPAGEQPLSLTFFKSRPWTDRNDVTLFVEGPGVARQALHAERPPDLPGAIAVEATEEPVVLRSFVWYGEGGGRRTHAASVGDPTGVQYAYDLSSGAPLAAWRGPFVETTEMWHERGNTQTARPLGSVVALPLAPALAFLAGAAAAWPDTTAADASPVFGGYALDSAGRPAFLYRLRGVAAEDRLRPADDGASLRRELRLRAPDATDGLFVRLAAGRRIRALADGAYAVDDAYFVVPERTGLTLAVRDVAGGQELIAPVRFQRGEAAVAYTIQW